MSIGLIILIVLLLFWPALSGATILKSAYTPPAPDAVRDSPLDPLKRKPKPMPAPAPTDHYAFTTGQAWTL